MNDITLNKASETKPNASDPSQDVSDQRKPNSFELRALEGYIAESSPHPLIKLSMNCITESDYTFKFNFSKFCKK